MSIPELVIAGNLLVDDLVFDDGRTRVCEPGGAVLYAALGAALWGVRVGLVSLRGDDYPAWALEALEARGIDLGGVRDQGGPGVRAWLLYEEGRRQIVHRLERPTHAEVSPRLEHVPDDWSAARAFHLTPMPLECQRALVSGLREREAGFVSLDPHTPLRESTLGEWRPVLERLDALFVGQDEMRLEGLQDDPRAALSRLVGGRLRYVAHKQGERGGTLLEARGGRSLSWPALAARVVDPTGAGDAFAGGFLAGVLRGDEPRAALRRAAVSASFALEDWGPRGLLRARPEDAQARLDARPGATLVSLGPVCAAGSAVELADEVRAALRAGRPVVALETTLVTHGLPAPDGLRTAFELEQAVRAEGALPATVGVLEGRLRVGLSADELRRLAEAPQAPDKLNLSNLAAQLARARPGSTTVAATLFAAARAGIHVCATGGIGGVHRDAAESGDVSGDLAALARFPVALVCSGAKALLDLPQTVERLETLGVPVYGFGCDSFPAFYRRASGLSVDARFDAPGELASAVARHLALGLGGVVVANPIPAEHELPREVYEDALEAALAEARRQGLRGRDLTPFLLERLRVATAGSTLLANRALLRDNARLAGRLAVALAGGVASGEP